MEGHKVYVDEHSNESRFFVWAWRAAFIPIVGVLVFSILYLIEMIRCAWKPKLGHSTIYRAFFVMVLVNCLYGGIYILGGVGKSPLVYNVLYFFLPKHGTIIHYTQANEIWEENWKFGIREGCGIKYNSKGDKIIECYYINNLLHGKYTVWSDYVKKIKIYEGYYKYGLEDGLWISWDNNIIVWKGYYKNGFRDGVWVFNLQKDGRRSEEGTYLNGQKNGTWTTWYENNIKRDQVEYTNGKKNGTTKQWDTKGLLWVTGNYLNDKKYGWWITYDFLNIKEQFYDANEIMLINATGTYNNNKRYKTWFYSIKTDLTTKFNEVSFDENGNALSFTNNNKPPQSIIEYKVQKGDNLINIANKFSISYADIIMINKLSSQDAILNGLTLKVPIVVPPEK